MPYVITTEERYHGGPQHRRAVATLEEAREWVYRSLDRDPLPVAGRLGMAMGLPESGGTLGPLPDGTVIEVEPVTWHDLIADGHFTTVPSPVDSASNAAEIVAAYNAAQGVSA
jgi:hypothetical protein